MKKKVISSFCIIIMLLISQFALVYAQEFMPVSEVRAGMHGVGKTVLTGDQIEDFYVEVLGVMPKGGIVDENLIMVRVYGDVIDRAGGVAQGMSGSPVYIDGKLVGAIAYGWSLSDGRTAMLTPIGQMLKMFDNMDAKIAADKQKQLEFEQKSKEFTDKLGEDLETTKIEKKEQQKTDDKEQKNSKKDKKTPAKHKKEQEDKNDEVEVKEKDTPVLNVDTTSKQELISKLRQYKTPLMVSGFTQKGLEMLQDKLKEFDVRAYETGGVQTDYRAPLQAGSAVSVDLVKGDLNVGALGTVTYVDEQTGRVLAFGHPFFKLGNIDYFMSNALMLAPVKSLNSSFKVGISGNTVGSIKQDRASGVAGELGKLPKTISLVVRVNDWDKHAEQAFNMQMIVQERLTRALLETSVVSLTDKVMDRSGEGTAVVSYDIKATNLPGGRTISRKNMYYSPENITELITGELMNAMSLMGDNRFQNVDISNIVVDVHITSECKVVRIESAKLLEDKKYAPGDVVDIQVSLQPYRSEPIKRIIEYKLPADLESGKLALMVRGGASIAWIQALIKQYQQKDTNLLQREMSKNKSFAKYIDEFNNQDRNQDIIVDIMPGYIGANKNIQQDDQSDLSQGAMNPILAAQSSILSGSKNKGTTETEFLVTGDTTLMVDVVKGFKQDAGDQESGTKTLKLDITNK